MINFKRFFSVIIGLFTSISILGQSIQGTAIDSASREPIPFALLNFVDIDASTLADEHGHFRFQGLLPEPIKIRCSALGFESRILFLQKTDKEITIALKSAHIELKEVNISASTGLIQKHTITNVESKSLEELSEVVSPNLSDALSNLSGVYNNSTGNGIGKPVIRGLTGNRVVTYNNGLRIENQQFGGDHGLGLTELGIAQVDVIKGPSSLLYGADALGGVIYFTDEKYTTKGNFESSNYTQWDSNTNGSKSLFGIKTAGKALRFNAYAYFNSSADYQLPSGGFLGNSRFQESAGKFALGYNQKKWVMNLRYSFQRSVIGLPGHTHDSLPERESFISSEQLRKYILPVQLINSHFALLENTFYLSKNNEIKFLTGFTSNHLKEHEKKVSIPGINNQLNTASYNLRWKKSLGKKSKLLSGVMGLFQRNHNHAGAEEVLIPQANLLDNGAYVLYHFTDSSFEFQGGLRYDTRWVENINTFKGTMPTQLFYQGINFSAGMVKMWEPFVIRSNVSSGFRPPHLNELMANGVHHGTIRYEKGNIELKSEYASQVDVSLEYKAEHLSLVFNPFYNYINNFIYLNPKDSMVETYPVFEYTQSNFASLWGGDLGVHYHPHFLHLLHLENSVSFIQAQDNNGNALPLIPQTRFNSVLRLQWEGKKRIRLENISVQHLYFLPQNQVGANETASPAYQLIHIGAQVKLAYQHPFVIKFGVRNLLNETYIDHLSRLKNIGIEAPGRNFYLGIKWNFTKTKSLHE